MQTVLTLAIASVAILAIIDAYRSALPSVAVVLSTEL